MTVRSILSALAVVALLTNLAPAAESADVEYLSDHVDKRVVSVSQQWGGLGINTAVKPADREAMPLRIKDQTYQRGLGHHATGEIVVDLAGQYKTFDVEVGIQWQGGTDQASAVCQIFVDDEKVFDSGVMRENDPPKKASLPVAGADELRLVATDADDGPAQTEPR